MPVKRAALCQAARTVLLAALLASPGSRATADEPLGVIHGTVSIAGASSRLDLSRAVVFLDAHQSLARGPAPGPRPQIAQRNKAFVPDLLVVPQGATVEFPNWDPFSHNVFSRSRAAQFDLDRYPQGMSKSYTFNNVGLVQVFCNIHPHMKAAILVVPNRHFARADARGRFALAGVPPGQYTLAAWHEQTGLKQQPISVGSGTQDVAVVLSARQPSARPLASRRSRRPAGVQRGLGVKRQPLNLPVVGPAHRASQPGSP